jgi:hypothetical protein
VTTPDDVRVDVDGPPPRTADEPSGPRGSRRRRIVFACVAAVLLVGVGLVAWTAVEAVRLKSSLGAAADDLTQLQHDATSGDLDAARALLPRAQQHAAAADEAAHSVPLRLVRVLPPARADVTAVAAMASTTHGLTADALPALVDALAVVAPDRLLDPQGRVDVDALARVAPEVRSADAGIVSAQRDVAAVARSRGDLHAPVADAVDRLGHALTSVRAQTRTAARAATLLPPMLGADGPRWYLVMVQNNAEFRSTGGIPGSILLVEADHGAVTVKEQRTESTLDSRDGNPVGTLTDDELTLFGAQPAVFAQDVNLIPDYPRSAELLTELWHASTGAKVDGVLSVDPVALGKVLGATGPVTVGPTKLTSENAAQVLLHDIYLRTNDPQEQDAFFAATARAVVDHLLGAGTPKAGVVDALAQSAREGRVMLWSAHPSEQSLLDGTVISGELGGHDGRSPVVGVYLNDGSAAKMSWFVDSTIDVRRTDGELVTTLTLKNTAPAGGRGLPSYLTGTMLPRGNVRTNYDLYAPTGGKVTSVSIDGKKTEIFRATYHGLDVAEWTAELAPGQSVTVEALMSVDSSYTGKPHVRATPAARGQHISVHSDIEN